MCLSSMGLAIGIDGGRVRGNFLIAGCTTLPRPAALFSLGKELALSTVLWDPFHQTPPHLQGTSSVTKKGHSQYSRIY